ncbi:MAG TPA: hypothetical protein VEW03_09050, partial [Longimicrobiaceae bacterium]|nr:hypothetical protein [Longimicrobiaceae bacterium]
MRDAERGKRVLDAQDVTEAAAPEARPRIQAYSETETGVHAIALEDALERFERCRHASSPEEDGVPLVWIDIAHPGEAEAEFLRKRLHFHPLAVE